jgi:hypothetical protein
VNRPEIASGSAPQSCGQIPSGRPLNRDWLASDRGTRPNLQGASSGRRVSSVRSGPQPLRSSWRRAARRFEHGQPGGTVPRAGIGISAAAMAHRRPGWANSRPARQSAPTKASAGQSRSSRWAESDQKFRSAENRQTQKRPECRSSPKTRSSPGAEPQEQATVS